LALHVWLAAQRRNQHPFLVEKGKKTQPSERKHLFLSFVLIDEPTTATATQYCTACTHRRFRRTLPQNLPRFPLPHTIWTTNHFTSFLQEKSFLRSNNKKNSIAPATAKSFKTHTLARTTTHTHILHAHFAHTHTHICTALYFVSSWSLLNTIHCRRHQLAQQE